MLKGSEIFQNDVKYGFIYISDYEENKEFFVLLQTANSLKVYRNDEIIPETEKWESNGKMSPIPLVTDGELMFFCVYISDSGVN